MPHTLQKLLLACTFTLATIVAQGALAASPDKTLVIKEQGDFFVGGNIVFSQATSSDGTNPLPAHVVVDQVYVQYQIPASNKHKLPIILAHGSWHTGKTYLSTPDGREGWATYFVRQGFSTYVYDDVNRGRSSYDITQYNLVRLGMATPDTLEPLSQTSNEAAWTSFRIGSAVGVPYPNTQFPVGSIDQYFAQLTDMFRGSDQAAKRTAGLDAVFDKVGKSILLTWSSTGPIGWDATLARPDLVKGIIAIEPINLPTFTQFAALAHVPVLIIRGDFDSAPQIQQAQTFVANLNAAGGNAKFISLPDIGINGNGHLMMMERNNLQIADVIIDWIQHNVE